MSERFARTEMVIGKENVKKLNNSKVAVFGIGGVGGHVVEALARAGIGAFVLVDDDKVSESNMNRQIIATYDTVGRKKVDVMKERILSINPEAKVETRCCFYLPENAHTFNFEEYSYVVDCVDTVTAKLDIIKRAKESKIPVISAMGTGNKLDPSAFKIADIFDTDVDPLSRIMRKECRKRGIEGFKVVYSTEKPVEPEGGFGEYERRVLPQLKEQSSTHPLRRSVPGSISFVPAAAGLMIAGEVVKDIICISK